MQLFSFPEVPIQVNKMVAASKEQDLTVWYSEGKKINEPRHPVTVGSGRGTPIRNTGKSGAKR